ncbi:double-stranded RNA-binding protein 2 [Tanacetum coccineum]
MYKNQLQELAQRSCFNLPSYTCIREGPDHAPRFKALVNFNGDSFESPNYFTTLRQAEHAAAEVALSSLSSHSLAARILDETGVYKNLLQEISQRVGAPLPRYTTYRSGLGHLPVFTGIVELAGITFTGEPAKNKKQAEKNAAMAAWSSLKQLAKQDASSSREPENNDEQEQIRIARALLNYRSKQKIGGTSSYSHHPIPFKKQFTTPAARPPSPQRLPLTTSKILPLFYQNSVPPTQTRPISPAPAQTRPMSPAPAQTRPITPAPHEPSPSSSSSPSVHQNHPMLPHFPAYVPMRQYRTPHHGLAPPVTMRTAVPVFSAPPMPHPPSHQVMQPRPVKIAPPVCIRQAVPVFSSPPPVKKEEPSNINESEAVQSLQSLKL